MRGAKTSKRRDKLLDSYRSRKAVRKLFPFLENTFSTAFLQTIRAYLQANDFPAILYSE